MKTFKKLIICIALIILLFQVINFSYSIGRRDGYPDGYSGGYWDGEVIGRNCGYQEAYKDNNLQLPQGIFNKCH